MPTVQPPMTRARPRHPVPHGGDVAGRGVARPAGRRPARPVGQPEPGRPGRRRRRRRAPRRASAATRTRQPPPPCWPRRSVSTRAARAHQRRRRGDRPRRRRSSGTARSSSRSSRCTAVTSNGSRPTRRAGDRTRRTPSAASPRPTPRRGSGTRRSTRSPPGRWTRGDAGAWRIGSLTKVWACPGLRIGYAIAPDADAAAAPAGPSAPLVRQRAGPRRRRSAGAGRPTRRRGRRRSRRSGLGSSTALDGLRPRGRRHRQLLGARAPPRPARRARAARRSSCATARASGCPASPASPCPDDDGRARLARGARRVLARSMRPLMVLGCTSNAGKIAARHRARAAGSPAAASTSCRSRRRTCRTTPASSTAARSAWRSGCRPAAAGVEPDVRMNPVLLKPEADTRSQVVVDGVGPPRPHRDAVARPRPAPVAGDGRRVRRPATRPRARA